MSSFPSKNNILRLFWHLLKSFSENIKQPTKMNDFLLFLRFMKTVGFCPVFITDMNSAYKNTLVSVYLLNFYIRQNFG